MRRVRRGGWVAGAAAAAATVAACSAPAAATPGHIPAAYGPAAASRTSTSVSAPVSVPASVLPTTTSVAKAAAATDVFTPAGAAAITAGQDSVSWLSWSLVDRRSGARTGSANSATDRTNAESSIKAWLGTDYLRTLSTQGTPLTSSGAALISAAIRQSDDDAAESLYRAAGGDQVLDDLASVCGVTVATSRPGFWSFAQITARDATTILDCVLEQAPTYPGGTTLVADLKSVDAADRFGIPDALPAGITVAVKNGWTQHSATGQWNVNCVAAWSHYALAVLTRYDESESLDVGADACKAVTTQILSGLR